MRNALGQNENFLTLYMVIYRKQDRLGYQARTCLLLSRSVMQLIPNIITHK